MLSPGRKLFPAAVLAALLLGLGLHWPSLGNGFRGDDYLQGAMYRGEFPVLRSNFDLFNFASGAQDENRRLMDFGHLPWWAAPDLRLRMWRPVSSALIAFDNALFGARADLYHWHSLAWFVLVLLAAARLLSKVLAPTTASLALLLFAISPCHTLPVGWLANRSTLLATGLGFFAVELNLRASTTLSMRRALATALVASLALLSGEYAVSALAYAFSYAWFASPELKWRARLQSAAPIVLPLGAYLVLHTLLGKDIVGSGYYLSPVHDPLGFVAALGSRVPVLVADLLFGIPSIYFSGGSPLRNLILSWNIFSPEVWIQLPNWTSWHVLIGYLAIAAALLLARRLLRGNPRSHPLRWLTAGAALGLLPCVGSLPEDRLLMAATLGSSVLVASALIECFPLRATGLTRRAQLSNACLWVALLWVPINAGWRTFDQVRITRDGSEMMRVWSLDADLPEPPDLNARVYVLAAGDFTTAVTLPWLRLLHGYALPRAYRRLCPGALPVDVTRSANRVLDVRVLTNGVRGTALPSLYRASQLPMHRGDHVELPGLRVDVLDVMDDNPTQLRFTFDRSVDDEWLWFLIATETGLRHRRMPAIGQTMRVPFAQFGDLRRGR